MGVRRGYRITGRVQGVGFRWWTRRLATELGLSGDVRNRGDGSVEVQAQGSVEALDAFEAELAKGPLGARVDAVRSVPPHGAISRGHFSIEGR